jgi:uncharacterized protein YecE (DUF72 family)
MRYTIGCSGFHYKHWKGDFYPEDLPVKKWFEYYCQYFSTLELNVTFYRFPTKSALEGWYQKSPEDFTFAVKAPRSITHYKKLIDTKGMISDFYNVIDLGLKEKLGCVLFQFPPNFACSEEHIQRILQSLDPAFKNVVEFRHISWWNKEVYDMLGKHGIGFCGMSHPDFPDDIISNTSHLYYRMHGGSQLYTSDYSHEQLDSFLKKLQDSKNAAQAFIYFNNDVKGNAVRNARYLMSKSHY